MNLLAMVPLPYRMLALALLVVASFAYGWIKGHASGEAKYQAFVAETRSVGEIAKKAADVQKAKDEARKEASDASYQKAVVALSADVNRLRDNAGRSSVPAAPADSRCPQGLACFDRGELDVALRAFTTDVAGFVAEGSAVKLRLDAAIHWAASP